MYCKYCGKETNDTEYVCDDCKSENIIVNDINKKSKLLMFLPYIIAFVSAILAILLDSIDLLIILVLILFGFIIALVVGMVSPLFVIRWGEYKNRTRKKVLMYYGIGIVLFYIIIRGSAYIMINNDISASPNINQEVVNNYNQTIKTTPKEIYNDFDNNKISANTEYKNKNISITGKIYIITEDGGTPSIGLVNSDNKYEITIPEVYCSFLDNKQNDKIAKLSKGDKVTIEGVLDMGGSSIYLKNCILK
jgi:hypothetical protein